MNLVAASGRGKLRARFACGLAIALSLSAPAWSATATGEIDAGTARAIMGQIDHGRWEDAGQLAKRARSPALSKLVEWFYLTEPGSPADFGEITRFVEQNPDWPSQGLLKKRAEEAINDSTSNAAIIEWFSHNPRQSAAGAMRYIDALLAAGRKPEAEATARQFLSDGSMTGPQLVQFASRYADIFRPVDFELRADRLIWESDTDGAAQVLPYLAPDAKAIARVRIAFAAQEPSAPALLSHLTPAQQNDLGILYERMRWLRRQNRDAEAIALLAVAPPTLPHPELWWNERAILARRALGNGDAKTAYGLARDHRQASGAALADGEWLSGWIALRFLNDPKAALGHFETMLATVDHPISVSRGAYWAGRAEEALGDRIAAQPYYSRAAAYIGTFYGQLALAKLDPAARLKLPKQPTATSGVEARAFNNSELVQVAEVLNAIGLANRAEPFVRRIGELARTPEDALLAMRLAKVTKSLAAEVLVAKKLMQGGMPVLVDGYPVLAPVPRAPEPPLIHAIIRQESLFDGAAVSPSGALGLMQLMPGTAKTVAGKLKMKRYKLALLTTDPRSNVELGSAYLADLVDHFGGSYVLAVAAYNAGPGRVAGWLRDNGDPRQNLDQTIDWIEKINVGETRNYVQRVMENLEIYRAVIAGRIGKAHEFSGPNMITTDLMR
ncbi:MAG TPA: lytic transglycosylase domain-containing protein [Alphaproteobacteria bacterium]|nr:lytic transglycosylase domain-containing protein [Alphaproteobacteria bacterium]